MREIKFRARITEDGKPKMFYQEDQYLISFLRRVTSHLYFEKDFEPEEVSDMAGGIHESWLKPYELENCLDRYTGISHKDDEWYEGDIIENDGDRYQIVWDDTEARFEAVSTHGGDDMALGEMNVIDTFKIGNTHENPELLSINPK